VSKWINSSEDPFQDRGISKDGKFFGRIFSHYKADAFFRLLKNSYNFKWLFGGASTVWAGTE